MTLAEMNANARDHVRGLHGGVMFDWRACPYCRMARWGQTMEDFKRAVERLGATMLHTSFALRNYVQACDPEGRWHTKQLRNGGKRVWFEHTKRVQPRPWKVDR